MRFRLFRSRAFWFGVPGLVFLLWGWWISMWDYYGAGFSGGPPSGVGCFAGEVSAFWNLNGWPAERFYTWHVEAPPMGSAREWPVNVDVSRGDPAFRHVYIPYWSLVFGYVVAWIGVLIWRKRKFEKRFLE